MERSAKIIKEMLGEHGVRPSYHRIRILAYLLKGNQHPTAEEIYLALSKELPTLSRTTVYNTVNVLKEHGLIKTLYVQDQETRYDAITELHGHFRCEECGVIEDFPVNVESLTEASLPGCLITEQGIYFKGRCAHCNTQQT